MKKTHQVSMQICSVYMHNGLNQWMKRLIYAWMNLEETLAKQRTLGDGLTEHQKVVFHDSLREIF